MEFLQEPELWVAVGLAFLVGVAVRFKLPSAAMAALDARGIKIQAELDEALRLRQEAQTLLAQIKQQREASEALAAEMMANAAEEAKRMAEEAEAKLEDQIKRRHLMAERKIANAQSQAEAQVKAAAADLASHLAEQVLAGRLKGLKTDPLIDAAVKGLGDRLQ